MTPELTDTHPDRHPPNDSRTDRHATPELTYPARWLKITGKHNLSTDVARVSTQRPKSRVDESATSRVYRADFQHVVCSHNICRVAATRTVRTVVNPSRLSDGNPRGVITSYCEGIVWCESWVKNAINI